MIFDVYFDKALWLMLAGDKKNRERIVEFIKSLPEEFHVKMRDAIRKYRDYKYRYASVPISERKRAYFNGEVVTGNGDLYWFDIDTATDTLNLGQYVLANGVYVDKIDMTLSSYKYSGNLKNFNKQLIGNVSYDFSKNVSRGLTVCLDNEGYNETKYSLMKTPIGSVLLSGDANGTFIDARVRRVNTRDIPCDYNISDLSSSARLNKLIRSKNQNNRFRR